jgi:hypothetical protein
MSDVHRSEAFEPAEHRNRVNLAPWRENYET